MLIPSRGDPIAPWELRIGDFRVYYEVGEPDPLVTWDRRSFFVACHPPALSPALADFQSAHRRQVLSRPKVNSIGVKERNVVRIGGEVLDL